MYVWQSVLQKVREILVTYLSSTRRFGWVPTTASVLAVAKSTDFETRKSAPEMSLYFRQQYIM